MTMITEERLDEMWEAAVRDDMHTILVPSDVRTLIRTIRELQKQLESSRSLKKPVVIPRRPQPSPAPPKPKRTG